MASNEQTNPIYRTIIMESIYIINQCRKAKRFFDLCVTPQASTTANAKAPTVMTISSKSIKKAMIATAEPSSKYTIAPKTTTKITSSTKKCHVNVKYKHSSLCLTAEFCRRCRVTCTKKVLPI